MPQAISGIILGGVLVFLLFFFEPWLLDDAIRWANTPSHGPGPRGAIAVFEEQPFMLTAGGAGDTGWYVDQEEAEDQPAGGCEAVFAIQNRTNHPLNIALAVHERVWGGSDGQFETADGPGPVALAPGAFIQQAVVADNEDQEACVELNRHGLLAVEAEACPGGEGEDFACEDAILDPADIVLRPQPGPPVPGAYRRPSSPHPYART